MIQPRLRIITVGDERVGKTWLIHMLCDKEIPKEYTPTTYENFCIDKTICGQMVTFSLRDTAGRPSLDDFRSICFNNADVFLLCFAADDRESFVNLQTKWIQYSKSKVENAKLILVETKCDLIHPEICKKEISTANENDNTKIETNAVPSLNLKSKRIDSAIRAINSKNEHKAQPKISIPKSSRNTRNHYLLDVLSSKKRSKSPPKLLNAYITPTTRSLADLPKERSLKSARKRSVQPKTISESLSQFEIGPKDSMNIDNFIDLNKPQIHISVSSEIEFTEKHQKHLEINSNENTNFNAKSLDSEFTTELNEIPEIDQIISEDEIKCLCIEEGISGFIKCSSKEGFQSYSILELAAKICVLKKKWTPPFRRRRIANS